MVNGNYVCAMHTIIEVTDNNLYTYLIFEAHNLLGRCTFPTENYLLTGTHSVTSNLWRSSSLDPANWRKSTLSASVH